MQNALKKVISIILIASLMMTNFCVYVKASDFKLSVIYLLDAIEDIEYRERESVYESEHLSFLMKEESTESEISEEIEVDEEEEVIEANSHEDNTHVDEFKNESDSIDESDDIVSTESEADEDKKKSTCEESSPSEVYQSNYTDEFYELEVSTLSEIKTIKTNKSTTSFIDEDTFLRATPAVEVFDLPITGGKYSVRAKTKKSSRGGQTFDGLLICGQVQAGVKSTDRYLLVECANADRHKVEFNLYKEDPNIGETCVYSETATNIGGIFSYPNYGTPVFPEEEKEFNVQIEIPYDRNGNIFSLDRLYHATEKASGCENVSNVEPVDPDSTITPMPMKNKHTGGIAYDSVGSGAAGHPNTIGDSNFLLYKVKYGDNLLKIALHYGVELADIAKDNHFSNLMCYEGDILFIRDPSFDEPYEKELTTAELASIKAELALMGYDVEHCDFFGEPINMSTGDFYLSHTDVEVEELSDEKFKISRSYNSKGRKIKSDFGYGFSSVVNDRLMVSSDGTVIHFDNDGGGEIYKNAGSGLYKTNTNGNVVKAIKNESGDEYATDEYDDSGGDDNPGDGGSVGRSNNWQLVYEDGSIATYNGYGSILSKKDRHGLTYTYNYDSSYRLSSIVTPSGLTFSFSYNGSNLIEKLTMPDGSSIKYEYDSDKNLVRVIDQENRATRYEYDSDHKMTAWYDADGIRQVLNTYDSSGRVVKQIDANGSESTLRYESDKTVVTDNEGNEQVYVLDDTKRTIGKEFTTSSSVGGVSHLTSEYARTFNSDNKTETKIDGNGVETTYTYDIRGNVLSEEKTDG
ncbi:MAG: LysM peptidoglycan-binding domain-containing protein, partial [Lachnospiraceae bacterium]|nr:LysM peptidoglycan-binding domain-containing protein [Lachnospiraceae bacterium]